MLCQISMPTTASCDSHSNFTAALVEIDLPRYCPIPIEPDPNEEGVRGVWALARH